MNILSIFTELDLRKLADPSYLFASVPEPNSRLVLIFVILFTTSLISSGITWIVLWRREQREPMYRRIREKVVRYLLTVGFVGLIIIFFRWQGVPYFGSRIVLLIWLIYASIWLGSLLRYLLKKFPQERRLDHDRRLKERYLPKPQNR